MTIRRLHRRLAVLMGGCALAAYISGLGFEPPSLLAAAALALALFWQPAPELARRAEAASLTAGALLGARVLYHMLVVSEDLMTPLIDLLLLLLCVEALKPLDAGNDARLYVLSFVLLAAATAFAPGVLFGISYVAYVVLATLALVVGFLARQAQHYRLRSVRVGRRFLWATAGLSAVTLAISAFVFVSFPRVPRGWVGRGAPELVLAGFAEQVSIGRHGSRIYANPEVVLRVEFPTGRPADVEPLYWRGRSYDHFDGVEWSRSPALASAAVPSRWYTERWEGAIRRQDIYGAAPGARVLFGMHPVISVIPRSAIMPYMDQAGDLSYAGGDTPVYSTLSIDGYPGEHSLRSAPAGFAPARDFYLQLPPVSPRVRRLADSLVAGAPTRYDQVRALEDWLRREFRYTRELPASAGEATLESFLFRRRAGHCEYFSTALVVLLRTLGIPARNVNGFVGGDWNEFGSYLAVTQNNAHSWVEVWFTRIGWVPFDATPPAGRAANAAGGRDGRAGGIWAGWLWVDALQHRWAKWVLDYDLSKQLSLVRRTAGAFSRQAEPGSPAEEQRPAGPASRPSPLLLALTAAVLLGAIAYGRGRRRPPQAARIYLALRREFERAGFQDARDAPPLIFLDDLRRRAAPGLRHAEKVVAAYLRIRFGGAAPEPAVLRHMALERGAARAALRAARRPRQQSRPRPRS
ncbi:MAG: DUF3488 domain-containing protein [Gemmatimonadetes bacterium]|nr:DUF3488 domain-containing protein [Gemmatimonadota bacterium]